MIIIGKIIRNIRQSNSIEVQDINTKKTYIVDRYAVLRIINPVENFSSNKSNYNMLYEFKVKE